ncbi:MULTISPECIES: spondin domain-containing protein [unclassified Colwellia]|uniref:spondin domain-containing protein n=1 Tax=unclassified Colwellia TaxID=196834 RepID=UPI0015F3B569|nr:MULTISPECIES: spondin domain-containing protein [unclassified Colwellia]MBA6349324.1 spondin domain-containing protein [Colwellia sp. BRX8-9]MBA6352426.1 spondin domain-containing protein [Colwellia sp. BRX9-1]MBA6356450.1 spondin domain-containing protein [Colwellia sp. BRX8-3]MBA6360786.1 spondin domain-containing protein [Colwellia sp. BRX8-6]MBA6368640.1 spondin domain-containing protein [Colwellia sp. BRX8-5]
MNINKISLVLLPLIAVLATGCGGDDGSNGTAGQAGAAGTAGTAGVDGTDGTNGADGTNGTNGNLAVFTVQLTNLTYSQPFSPAAIILHEPGYHAFIDGEAASLGLEQLAEGGDPTELLAEALAATQYLDATTTDGATGPRSVGTMSTLVVPLLDVDNLRLSFTTMLVDTNDAFTGLNAADISNMTVGQSMSFMAPTWDSGTEANTETATTMPGPAAGAAGGGGASAGFDAARDDLFDLVHFHRGVVTNANANDESKEGLSTSVLTEADRWDNPTSRIIVTRTR